MLDRHWICGAFADLYLLFAGLLHQSQVYSTHRQCCVFQGTAGRKLSLFPCQTETVCWIHCFLWWRRGGKRQSTAQPGDIADISTHHCEQRASPEKYAGTCQHVAPSPETLNILNLVANESFSYLGSILSYLIIAIPIFAGAFDGKDASELSAIISAVCRVEYASQASELTRNYYRTPLSPCTWSTCFQPSLNNPLNYRI